MDATNANSTRGESARWLGALYLAGGSTVRTFVRTPVAKIGNVCLTAPGAERPDF